VRGGKTAGPGNAKRRVASPSLSRPTADRRLIGVDVGGTKVVAAALEGPRLTMTEARPTDTSSSRALIEEIVAAVAPLLPADAIGVAVPSVIDAGRGAARFSTNVPLADVPLREILRERLGLPVFVDNDATCAALAEAYDDAHRLVARHLVLFTVGTGVGGGVVIDGRVFRGATGAAGELGHTLVAAKLANGAPPHAAFPRGDSLEGQAAGRALDRLAAERGLGDGRGAVAAARAGRPSGTDLIRILGERLGVGIANAINTFDPDLVLVGGGVAAAGELLLAPAVESARRFILPGVGTATRIRLARYGNEAGVRGAALLAGQELVVDATPGRGVESAEGVRA
jgi:glucokinase